MKSIKIGIGRIYNVRGFEIVSGEEISFKYQLGKIEVGVFIGPTHRQVIMSLNFGPPQPKDDTIEKKATKEKATAHPDPKIYPADLYCEVIATKKISVDDELAELFFQKDKAAADAITKLAAIERETFLSCLDFVCGYIGLQISPFLVKTLIVEQSYLYRTDSANIAVNINYTVIKPFKFDLSVDWTNKLYKKVKDEPFSKTWNKKKEIFVWLLRAWSAEDPILRFVSLFIPLERVIPSTIAESELITWETNQNSLIALIKNDSHEGDQQPLINFVQNLRPLNTTSNKFKKWASEIRLDGWENDIAAFQKFKEIRDKLVHGSRSSVELKITLDQGEVKTLEELTEKYISYYFFMTIYT